MLLVAIVACYLLGSLNTATIVSRCLTIDIKKVGTENAGTWNVWHQTGWKPGLVVLAVDMAKGALATWVGISLSPNVFAALPSLAVIAGHNWPLFFKFDGGKGFANILGSSLALNPLLFFVSLPGMLLLSWIRWSGLGPFFLLLLFAFPGAALFGRPDFILFSIGAATLHMLRRFHAEPDARQRNIWNLIRYDAPERSRLSLHEVVFPKHKNA